METGTKPKTSTIASRSRAVVKQSLKGKSLDDKCSIMDAQEERRFYQETNTALGYTDELLDIFRYIDVIKFEIDQFMLNKFWQTIAENMSADISAHILNWLGYDNEKEKDNKSHFIELLNPLPFE